MASISALRDAIQARLATIPGLRAHDIVPSQVNPPAAVVIPATITYDATMRRGSDDFTFVIQLVVSKAVDRVGQDRLDAFLSPFGSSSVKAAVDGDLDGAADFAHVASVDSYGAVEWGGIEYFGAELTVNVTASREV